MATAPELLGGSPEAIRAMRDADVHEIVAIERSSYQFPWSEGIFRDCLRVGYTCRVVTLGRQVAGYGVMSVGAGEAHILNLCVGEAGRCRRHERGIPGSATVEHRSHPALPGTRLRAGRHAARLLPGCRRARGRGRATARLACLTQTLELSVGIRHG